MRFRSLVLRAVTSCTLRQRSVLSVELTRSFLRLLRSALLRGLLRSLLPNSGLRLPLGSGLLRRGLLPGGLLCSRPLLLCSSPLVRSPLRLLLRLNLPFSSP